MRTSRRSIATLLPAAGAAAVLALTACGSASSTSTAGSTAGSTGGTTVVSGAATGPAVIHLGGGGFAPSPAAENAPAMSTDAKMAAFRNVTYVFDGELPVLADTARSWVFPAGFVPDPARIAAMAATLGVEGEVREVPADQGGGWMFGPADYSAATFMVSADSQGSWWFSPAPSVQPTTSACGYGGVGDVVETAPVDSSTPETATPETADGIVAAPAVVTPPPCPEPVPPANVPGEEQAIAAATTLLSELGYDPAAYDLDYFGDEWGASVTVALLLDGQRSPVTMSFGFGEQGALTWAYGSLASPVVSDTYPLAGVQAGLDRLNDQARAWLGLGGFAGGELRTETAADTTSADSSTAATDAGVTADPTEPVPSPEVSVVSEQCDPTYCTPIDSTPITIHLSTVSADLTMVWDVDGTARLLPAYTFGTGTPEDGTYTIIAVADEYLDVPEAVAVPLPEPMPATIDTTTADTTTDTTADTAVTEPTG